MKKNSLIIFLLISAVLTAEEKVPEKKKIRSAKFYYTLNTGIGLSLLGQTKETYAEKRNLEKIVNPAGASFHMSMGLVFLTRMHMGFGYEGKDKGKEYGMTNYTGIQTVDTMSHRPLFMFAEFFLRPFEQRIRHRLNYSLSFFAGLLLIHRERILQDSVYDSTILIKSEDVSKRTIFGPGATIYYSTGPNAKVYARYQQSIVIGSQSLTYPEFLVGLMVRISFVKDKKEIEEDV